jgi:cephalosporin-C deacetylase-like acetyl esterase
MRSVAVLVLLSFGSTALAQENLQVLDAGPQPRKMLYRYLLAQCKKHFDARRQAVAAVKTPADLARRQQELKARFVEALGGFPEKTPLNAKVVGRLPGKGFHVEKVIYESRPGHHVTAALYLPDGNGPFPGVLVPCGHSANGKAAEAYQRACILMARNGLAVLCYDPIGQGERVQLLDGRGKPALAGSTSEHTMVGIGALLVGRCTATYRVWDGIRSLDYLAGRPEVDPRRLGCTGNSGGGTMTAYLMALDDRIGAAAPSCYVTTLERLFATIGPQDGEQNIPGQVAYGMEHADYLTMRAPRPTLMCIAKYDFFDEAGAWASFREATLLYGLLGHGERVALFEYPDKHGFTRPRREAALRWMRRWLLHKDDAAVEGPFPVFTDRELQCTRSGQVLLDFHGKSVVDFNAEAARELATRRGKAQDGQSRDALLAQVKRLLGLPERVGTAKVELFAAIKLPRYGLQKMVFETEPGVLVPGLRFSPAGRAKRPLVLYLDGEGMASAARPGGPVEQLVKAGKRILALDLRGMGETLPDGGAGDGGKHAGRDWREAFLGQHLSRPLLGQRVYDLLAVVNCLEEKAKITIDETRDEIKEVEVIGVGTAGPVALHAAALDPRIRSVVMEKSVVSWSAVAAAPISTNQMTNAVHGVLRVYDLPELAGLIAPRPLTMRSAVDPLLRELSQADAARAYIPCRAAYERRKAGERFSISGAP